MAIPLLTHTWTLSIKNDSGTAVIADQQIILGDSEQNNSLTVQAGTTAEIDNLNLDPAHIVSLLMNSDQPVSIATNASDGTGGQIITLAANKAYTWNNLQPTPTPLTAVITKLFITNGATKDAKVRLGFLLSDLA